MSTSTSSKRRVPQKASRRPPKPRNLLISTRTSATRWFFTTKRSFVARPTRKKRAVSTRVERCRRPSQALPPPPAPQSLAPQRHPPSPDPASEFGSWTSTHDTASKSSTSGKGGTAYSTLPTTVGSASCQGSTLTDLAALPSRSSRPVEHALSSVQAVYPPRAPGNDLMRSTGVGGIRRPSLPPHSTLAPQTSIPKVVIRPSTGVKLTFAPLPSPFAHGITIPKSQARFPSLQSTPRALSGPISIVPSAQLRDHGPGGPGLPSRPQKPTTATAHTQFPPYQYLQSHARHGGVSVVPPQQSSKAVSHEVTRSYPKPAAFRADLVSPGKKLIDHPTVVQKPPPPPQKAPKYTFIPRWFSRPS